MTSSILSLIYANFKFILFFLQKNINNRNRELEHDEEEEEELNQTVLNTTELN